MAEFRKVAAQVRKFEKGLNNIARAVLKEQGNELVNYIKKTKFRSSGDPGPDYIVSRTRALEGSLRSVAKFRKGGVVLEISMTGVQARILEEGGKTKAHPIRPRGASVLAFPWAKRGGEFVFFGKVNHPGSVFTARDVMGRSFEERSTQIIKEAERLMAREWEARIA
jgi:hypothetical protein